MSDPDIRDLLGRAFGEEPPLGIDRDEVLASGRKRLRRRRFFEAGGVVALVVVAAVGAATLTRLVDPVEELPPAASDTLNAPPGPELPVTAPPPPSAQTTRSPVSVHVPQSEQGLTVLLYSTGVVTEKDSQSLPGRTGHPAFRQTGDSYVFEADVQRAKARGYVQVAVDFVSGGVVACDGAPRPYGGCEITMVAAERVSLSRYNDESGERRTRAEVVSSGGVRIVASASNITVRDRDAKLALSPDSPPVLSDSELCTLVTKVGQSV